MTDERGVPDREERMIDALWELIQEAKRLVSETRRLAELTDRVRRTSEESHRPGDRTTDDCVLFGHALAGNHDHVSGFFGHLVVKLDLLL
jgi:hypothetical protein